MSQLFVHDEYHQVNGLPPHWTWDMMKLQLRGHILKALEMTMQAPLPLHMNHLVFRKTSFGDTAIAAYTDFEMASAHASVATKQAAQAFERVKDGRLPDIGSAREAVPYDPTLQLDASLRGYEVVSVPVIDGVRALTEDGLLPWHPASKAPAGPVESGMQAAWAKALSTRK